MIFHMLPGSMLYPSPSGGRNDPYSMRVHACVRAACAAGVPPRAPASARQEDTIGLQMPLQDAVRAGAGGARRGEARGGLGDAGMQVQEGPGGAADRRACGDAPRTAGHCSVASPVPGGQRGRGAKADGAQEHSARAESIRQGMSGVGHAWLSWRACRL